MTLWLDTGTRLLGAALRDVRGVPVVAEPDAQVRPAGACAVGSRRRSPGGRRHHAAGRVQDRAQHAGDCSTSARAAGRRRARAASQRPARLPQGRAGARAVPDAGRRHLLAHLRELQARAGHGEYPCGSVPNTPEPAPVVSRGSCLQAESAAEERPAGGAPPLACAALRLAAASDVPAAPSLTRT